MTKRKVLAAATVATLLMCLGTAQPISSPAAVWTEQAPPGSAGDQPAGPQWVYVWGFQSEDALAFAIMGAISCAGFGPWGGLACAVTGAL